MPLDYSIDVDRRLIRTLAWGTLTLDEIVAVRQRVAADPRFEPGFDELMDLIATDTVDFTGDDLRRLASNSVLRRGVRRALVTGMTSNYGVARMFQAFAEMQGYTVGVFKTLDDAIAWLGEPREAQ